MRKTLLTPVAVAMLAFGAGPASAWEGFTIGGDPGYKNLSITASGINDISTGSTPVPNRPDQPAGRFIVNVAANNSSHGGVLANSSSFYTYCVELTQWLASPTDAGMNYQVVASTAQVTAAKLADLGKLYTLGFASSGTGDAGTGFQAAVWEIVYETAGTYNLSAGNIYFGQGVNNKVSLASLSAAQTLLNNLGTVSTPLYSLQVLHSDYKQDYLVATPVPEPEGYALALAGLACIGVFGRKLRAAKKA